MGQLTEQFIYDDKLPGFIGFYHNSDGSKHWIRNQEEIDKINSDIDSFFYLMKDKGEAANYAFKYRFGYKRKDDVSYVTNFDFLCADAWYSSNYLFIENFPGYEGKKIAFCLRISDHPVRPTACLNANGGKRKKDSEQFVLNMMIDPKVNNRNFDRSQEDTMGMVALNVIYNPQQPNPQVEELVRNVIKGKQVVYDYSTILRMFGIGNTKIERFDGDISVKNFNKEKPQTKQELRKIKKIWFDNNTFSGQSSIIENINGFDYEIEKPKVVNINGTDYYQIKIDNNYYVMDSDTFIVRKRGQRRNELTPNKLSEPMVTERKIKISENDIQNMVFEVIKKLKRGF